MGDKPAKFRPRIAMPEQDPQVRQHNFQEVPLGYSAEQAQDEAARCLKCKKPVCMKGCPVSVDIPAFIELIVAGKFAEAARRIKQTNCLPAVCGRVCPQESQCESLCLLGKKSDPVAIGRLERFAADYEREHGLVEIPAKQPSTGKRVAVVGAGPAGLTVAGDLVLLGHDVTIFEAFHKAGGVLVYGIPEFRLPKNIVQQEVDYLERLGAHIELNQVIGKSITVEELLHEEGFDAVFVGVGAGLPHFMGVPGENLGGVYSANEYLTRSNLMKAYAFPDYNTPVVHGRNVCVIGGGNVAMDAARTARRLGAENVYILYRRSREELPARAEEVHHAEQEGNHLPSAVCTVGVPGGRARHGPPGPLPGDGIRRARRFGPPPSRSEGGGRVHARHRSGHRGHRLGGQSVAHAEHAGVEPQSPRLHCCQRVGPHHGARRVGRRRHRHRQCHGHPRDGGRPGRRARYPSRAKRRQRIGVTHAHLP